MDRNEAARILRRLGDGIDPATERPIEPEDALSVLNRADSVRAILFAVNELEQQQRRARTPQPANRGKPWTEEEDRKLLSAFDMGRSVSELAESHQRNVSGIRARLVKYGRIAA